MLWHDCIFYHLHFWYADGEGGVDGVFDGTVNPYQFFPGSSAENLRFPAVFVYGVHTGYDLSGKVYGKWTCFCDVTAVGVGFDFVRFWKPDLEKGNEASCGIRRLMYGNSKTIHAVVPCVDFTVF